MTPTLTKLDLETAARLRAVVGSLSRRLRPTPAAVAAGLTPTRASVLQTVVRKGPIGLSELAALEGINPTQLSRTIGQLLESGLVERSTNEGDRRAASVKPDAGRQATGRADPARAHRRAERRPGEARPRRA